jgi:outer membrane protein assembly factor BamA/autotransporter translocation and assembly factor TamB
VSGILGEGPPPASANLNPRPWWRRPLRLALVIIFCALLLMATLLIGLQTPPAKRYVLARVGQWLAENKATRQIDVQASALDYSLFTSSPSLTLDRVVIRSRAWPDAPPFARIERATVMLSLPDLLHGKYIVRQGALASPDVHLLIDEQGRTNLPELAETSPKPAASTPVDYLIEHFAIANGRIRYEDRRQHLDLTMPVSSVEVTGDPMTRRHEIQLTAGQGQLRLQDKTMAIERIAGRVGLTPDGAQVERLDLTAAGSTLSLAGNLIQFADPRYDLSLQARLDVTRLAAFAGLPEPVGGIVTADVKARGPLTALAVRTQLHGEELSFRTLKQITLDADAAYDAAARQARVMTMNVSAPLGKLHAGGLLALDAGAGNSQLTLDVDTLDLAQVTRALQVPYSAASLVRGQAHASWPALDYEHASGDAKLTLTPTTARTSKGAAPLAGTLVAAAKGDVVTVDVTRLEGLGAIVDGRVTLANPLRAAAPAGVARPRGDGTRAPAGEARVLSAARAPSDTRRVHADDGALGGTLRVRTDDLSRVVPSAETFLGRRAGSLVPVPVAGPLVIDARLGGTTARPTVDAAIDTPGSGLTVSDLNGITLRVQARYAPDAVSIASADLAWQDARAHASGSLGLTRRQPIALALKLEQTPLAPMLAAAGHSDLPVTGAITLDAEAHGTLANPIGKAALKLSGLRYEDESLGDVIVDADVAGQQANIRAAADAFKLTANAQVGTAAPYHAKAEVVLDQLDLQQTPVLRQRLGATEAPESSKATEDKILAKAVQADQAGKASDKPEADQAAKAAAVETKIPLEGIITARLTAEGDLTKPKEATATVTLDPLALRYSGQPIETDGPSTVRYAAQRLDIDRLIVKARDSRVALKGTLPLDATAPNAAADGAVDLDAAINLATLADYAPKDLDLHADGTLALRGSITGSLARIDPKLTLTVDNASLNAKAFKQPLEHVGVKVDVADGAARIDDVHASWGTMRLTTSGSIPFGWLPEKLPVDIPRQTGAAQLQASITGVDLAALPVAGAPEQLTGAVAVRADFSAERPDVAALTGTIAFPQMQLAFNGLTLAQQGESTIALDNGDVRVERFALDGTAGRVDLSGHAGLTDPRPLDLSARANLNAGALSALTKSVRAAGRASLEVRATGTATAPSLNGFVELANGRISVDDPQIAAQGLNLRIDFTPERATLARLEGSLNGGTLSGSGSVGIAGMTMKDLDVDVKATDVALEAPLSVRSLTNADIRITQRADPSGSGDQEIVIGGQATIQEAGLTDDINLDTGIFQALTAPRSLDLTEERSAMLERVRFDLKVTTATPIIVDNNLARAEIDADLRLLGTPYETGLSGRMELSEGSVLILNERTYNVQRGVITFIDDRRIQPSLDLELETTARKYDITIDATGTPDDTKTTLTSTPSLPEPDIMALLVTGRTLDEMRGDEFDVAKTQVLSYLGGRVGSQLGRGLQRATGLSTVRVEPNLIANEADPSARLTVGQDLTDDLSLVYSTDLVNSSDHIWIAEYDVSRQFSTRAVRQSDDSYRFDFRHDVRFGGTPEPSRGRRTKQHVGTVAITGQPAIGEEEIRRRFKLKAGDKYDFFKSREGVKRIARLYREQDWLQPRIRVERTVRGDEVDLALRINAGPKVSLVFDGFTPSNDLVEQAETLWSRGVFDTQRADDVKDAIRASLVSQKYVNPTIEYEIESGDRAAKRVTFHVTPGTRFEKVTLAFEGASGIPPRELEAVIKEQKLGPKVFTNPGDVTDLLRRLYRERGFLAAQLDPPRPEFDEAAGAARVVLAVHEGPQFKIRSVTIAGNRVYDTAALLGDVPTVKGDPYYPAAAELSLTRIRQLYWSKGYNDVRPTYSLAVDRNSGLLDVRFAVNEGRRMVVASIDVQGTDKTSDALVREQMELAPGAPLDLSALSRSRKNLYGTGAYAMVDITRDREETPPAPTVAAPAAATTTPAAAAAQTSAPAPAAPAAPIAAGDEPVQVNVGVREVQPFQIRYGALFDTERGVGGILDVANHNSLGKARVVGLRSRYDSQLREARLYLSQPSLRALPVETIASIYYREERNPATSQADAFNVDRMGVTIQQEKRLRDHYVWSYGYRFEHARTYEAGLAGPLPPYQNVSPLTTTLTRETRDEVLDATTGAFFSQAFSFSPQFLGSDVRYVKYFGQYFRYFPLRPPTRERFTNNILRPRLVYAVAVRVGLANGLGSGQVVPLSERFLAGGSTTLRGFSQNAVGPIGSDGVPLGGEAMLVFNNEVRFPLFKIFDGVAFVDIGNVFNKVTDFSLTDLRESGGIGLRARTPWFLLRADYGIPFDRRPGESRSRIFFSIGQAF